MGNCVSHNRHRRHPKKPLTLALLGVDNSGKTTASFSFSGEQIDPDVAPTVGFRNTKFTFGQYEITLFDVGGGKNIRPIWKNYFPEVYGFIYVVDSSTSDRMDEVRETLRESLEHPQVSGKPVLLLANKQDKPDALDEVDICELLNLETIVNINKCPCRIETCSTLKGTGKKMDPRMRQGLSWLIAMIEKQGEELQERIKADMAAVKELQEAEAAARRERVRKRREEREKEEEEERKRLGINKKESDDEDVIDGDPFKPLDLNELTQKEKTLKEEKRALKELEAKIQKQEALEQSLSATDHQSVTDTPKLNNIYLNSNSSNENSVEDANRLFVARTRASSLPPLEPLGTPFMEDSGLAKKRKKKKKLKSPHVLHGPLRESKDESKDDDDDIITPLSSNRDTVILSDTFTEKSIRTASNIQVSTHDDFPSRQLLAAGLSKIPQESTDGNMTPRSKKVKKKVKKSPIAKVSDNGDSLELEETKLQENIHQLSLQESGDLFSAENEVSNLKKKNRRDHQSQVEDKKYEVSRLPEDSSVSKISHQKEAQNGIRILRNSQMHSNTSLGSDQFGSKSWGLAEELPAVADDSIAFRRPNFDENDFIL